MFEIEQYVKDFFRIPRPDAQSHWVEEYEEMIVHTRGKRPDTLIKKRRPYEDPDIMRYRLENYEPITKDITTRSLDTLRRILSRSTVTIETTDQAKEYFDQPIFKGVDFSTYINKFVIRRMIEDSNGLLVWWVGIAPETQTERAVVQPILLLSSNIMHLSEDVLSWLSTEKSEVTTRKNNKTVTVKEGKVYYIVTKDTYYKLVQFGAKSKNQYRLETAYVHNLERLPIVLLGGEESGETDKKSNDELIWMESYFSSFVPYANEAIRQFSDHQGVMVTNSYPIREMERLACTNKFCKDGIHFEVKEDSTEPDKATCGTCSGRGYLIPTSPYGVFLRPKRNSLSADKTDPVPAMRYISPPVDVMKYGGEHWEKLLEKAERALNMLFIKEAQSGIAKEIDREDKVAMLDKIGANVYMNIIRNSMMLCIKLMSLGEDNVVINLPPTFTVRTEEELQEELKSLGQSNVSGLIPAETSKEYIKQRFSGDKSLHKIAEVLSLYDPLFGYTEEQKANFLRGNTINLETYQKSIFAYTELNRLAATDENFEEMEYGAIATKLDAEMAKYAIEGRQFDTGGSEV